MLARAFNIWWPHKRREIRLKAQGCTHCSYASKNLEPLIPTSDERQLGQQHFASLSGKNLLRLDFAKAEIVNTRSIADWNYPSDKKFDGQSADDIPEMAPPASKRAPPKPRVRNRNRANASRPALTTEQSGEDRPVFSLANGKVLRKNRCAIGAPIDVAPPSSNRTTRQRTAATTKGRSRPGHVSKRHRSISSDEPVVNSPSPPPEPSSTDSDVPPRRNRRSATVPLPQIDPATTPAATAYGPPTDVSAPLPDHVDAQLDDSFCQPAH